MRKISSPSPTNIDCKSQLTSTHVYHTRQTSPESPGERPAGRKLRYIYYGAIFPSICLKGTKAGQKQGSLKKTKKDEDCMEIVTLNIESLTGRFSELQKAYKNNALMFVPCKKRNEVMISHEKLNFFLK